MLNNSNNSSNTNNQYSQKVTDLNKEANQSENSFHVANVSEIIKHMQETINSLTNDYENSVNINKNLVSLIEILKSELEKTREENKNLKSELAEAKKENKKRTLAQSENTDENSEDDSNKRQRTETGFFKRP